MAMLAPQPRSPPSASPSIPLLPAASFRPSPIRRRSTIKRSIAETDMADTPSSPSKRPKVTFDPDIELVSADDEDDADPLVVGEQVRWAIQRHLSGDDESYQRIKSLFLIHPEKENAPSSRTLSIHLQAVLANISTLNKSCNGLVDAVLYSEWVGRDDAFSGLFIKFLGNLAAAQGGYLGKCLHMLVDLLGQQKTRRLKDTKAIRQLKIHQRVLQALRYITRLIPSASGTLADAIRRKLSYDFAKAEERIIYVKNFIQLTSYVPELTSDILSSVMNELVKLDVAIQSELDEEDDEVEDEVLNPVSSSQTLVAASLQDLSRSNVDTAADDDASTSDESEVEDGDDLDPAEVQRRKLKEDVQQVDLIMDMLFQHYTKQVSASVKGQNDTIDQLIAQFHNIILPTYRSRHPQFLIFHFAQMSPVFVDQFVTSCIRVLVDKKQPQTLRHSAAAFFSGFVGRGVQVSPSVVQDCMDLLCDQLNSLRKQYEPGCRGPDLKRYSDFYTTTQAILYIFCFRWRDLASASSDFDDDSDVEDDDIEHFYFPDKLRDALNGAIFSTLNPLRICTPVIVEQFAKITFALEFLYLHSKIEANKHVRLVGQWRSVADLNINQPDLDMSWADDNGMMEGYFPYDPYRLPISKNWLEQDYVEWKGVPGEEQDDHESEDEDDMTRAGVLAEDDTASDA